MNIEWKDFTNSITDETSGNVKILQSNYLSAGQLPIVDQGKKLISGYTNDLKLRASVELPCIIFGDHTKILKYIDFPFALGADGVKVLKPSDDFNSKYLYYYLKQIKLSGKKSYNRNFKYLKIVKLPFIPLPEQKLIAELLDKADSIRQKREESIALLDEFLRSVFLDMFGDPVRNEKGWEKKTFENLVTIERNQISPEDIENDTIYVDLEAIQKETGKIINYRKVQNGYIKSSKFLFTSEHILYGKLRPYLNKVALPNFVGVCSTDILPILPKDKVSNKFFISQLMRSSYFVNYMDEKSSGANLPRVNVQTIYAFNSITPPYNLQTQFAKIVEQVEVTKAKMEESLREMDNQFEGLLGRVFG